MTDDSRRIPIKVKVVDKRKTNTDAGASENPSEGSRGVGADEAAASAPFTQTVSKGSLRDTAASSDSGAGSPVDDESDSLPLDSSLGVGSVPEAVSDEGSASASSLTEGEEEEEKRDYLDDLVRLQAEFDNFRKRSFKERQTLEARGMRRLVERLLPVMDNFELAIAHGEGGAGVELVFKELKSALEGEGLAAIPAEGEPFDPNVHDAVESVEDPDVEHATVTKVYRRGYTFGGEVVRPAMVVVARPVEETESEDVEPEVAEGGG